MRESTTVAEHVNIFNKIISYLHMKLDEHDKTLIFLTPLPPFYNYLVATIFYEKQILFMEDVPSTLLSEDIMKQSISEEPSEGLVVKDAGRGRHNEHDLEKERTRSKSRPKKGEMLFLQERWPYEARLREFFRY